MRVAIFALLATILGACAAGVDRPQPNDPSEPNASRLAKGANEAEIAHAIRHHVMKFLLLPPGAKDSGDVDIEIRVGVLPDGTVADARVENPPMMPDSFWTAASNNLLRAVRLASPLPIPRDKVDQFKDFVLVFNPKQMVSGR